MTIVVLLYSNTLQSVNTSKSTNEKCKKFFAENCLIDWDYQWLKVYTSWKHCTVLPVVRKNRAGPSLELGHISMWPA